MNHLILYGISILCSSIGLLFDCLYLNVFTLGYTFWDYVYLISRRIECNLLFIGLFLLAIAIKKKGCKK